MNIKPKTHAPLAAIMTHLEIPTFFLDTSYPPPRLRSAEEPWKKFAVAQKPNISMGKQSEMNNPIPPNKTYNKSACEKLE